MLRRVETEVPYAENLIHRTERGHLVRSKSELVIANMLFQSGVEYEYERATARSSLAVFVQTSHSLRLMAI